MRVTKRILKQRVQRLTLRANANAPAAEVPTPVTRKRAGAVTARQEAMARPEGCRRQSCRVPIDNEVAVKKLGGFGFQLRACNASTGGCRVELIEMVDAGERVIVRLPALEPLGAEVAWVEGASAGLHFQRALHSAVFDQLMDRLAACAA
ncbi:MAG TPA: PilZ domain-containing protein [Sphingomicrobium sp.]|jgi:hypothetical protein|nr:PilZ domain-containing protein [Sphingomicrobium sp.]